MKGVGSCKFPHVGSSGWNVKIDTGLSCRFPRGGEDVSRYHAVQSFGGDCSKDLPSLRFGDSSENASDNSDVTCFLLQHMAHLDGAELFDNAVFRVSTVEAKLMDPQ